MTIPELSEFIASLNESRQDWFVGRITAWLKTASLNKNDYKILLYLLPREELLEILECVEEIKDKELAIRAYDFKEER